MRRSASSRACLPLFIVLLAGGCAQPTRPPAADGAVTLEWATPSTRMDGGRLSAAEIAGYRIYVGEHPDQPQRVIEVDDPSRTHHVVDGLRPGQRYYFALSTIDAGGRESPKSGWIRREAVPLPHAGADSGR